MNPPCLRMMSACCGGVERDRRVEVREEDDQHRVEADVPPALVAHQVVVDPLLEAGEVVTERRRDQRGERQDRAREDHRDHTRLVDLQRDVGALAAVHPAADDPFRELDRDPPLPRLDEHDADDHRHADGEDGEELDLAALAPDGGALRREARHHRREDQDRHAVADAALGDELGEPHHHGGAGGPGEHDERGARRRRSAGSGPGPGSRRSRADRSCPGAARTRIRSTARARGRW